MALHLEIVTPKGSAVAVEVEKVSLPGKLGEFGILEGHIPFLSALKPGLVNYEAEGKTHQLAVGTGFVEVGAHEKVLVLTDEYAEADQIDLGQVEQELEELEAQLKDWTGELTVEHQELKDEVDWLQAQISLKSDSKN